MTLLRAARFGGLALFALLIIPLAAFAITQNFSITVNITCPFTQTLADGCTGAQTHGTIVDAHLADPQAVIDLNVNGGSGYTNGTFAWTSTGGGCTTPASGTITVVGGLLGGAARGAPANFAISNRGAGCTSRPTIAVPAGAGAGTGGSITPTVYQLTPHNCTAVTACNSANGSNWSVAGVDYPVGYNTTLSLLDPTTAGLPSGCTFAGSTVTCAGSGGTLNGYDFSLHTTNLSITASGWTISNNNFVCGATSAGQMINVGSSVTSVTIQYNNLNGNAKAGVPCVSGGLTASVNSDQATGTAVYQYNYCFNTDAKCYNNEGGTSGSPTLTITEQYNYSAEIGVCGGATGCAHSETEYAYSGNANRIINWTLQFNTGVTHYWAFGPVNTGGIFAQDGDGYQLTTTTVHNFVLSRGTQSYTGNSNGNAQSGTACLFCGAQVDPGTGSLHGTIANNIWEYSGGFFVINPDSSKIPCTTNITIADFNAGTGNTCNSSVCN